MLRRDIKPTSYLIQIGKTIWILAESFIEDPKIIPSCSFSEFHQINNIQGTAWIAADVKPLVAQKELIELMKLGMKHS